MKSEPLHAVTGAFGYCGRHITEALLDSGCMVRNLTGHPDRPGGIVGVETRRLDLDDAAGLREILDGVDTLFNTYWVRFEHGSTTFDRAVRNSLMLFGVAAEVGVRRIVHVSITNPDCQSPLPYFRGKAIVESGLKKSGVRYAILRPALFFGGRDVLINNIAWLLRRFPFFAIPGAGDYRIQPIHVEDFARLAVDLGGGHDDVVVDAVGPEIRRFDEMVHLIARAVGSSARIVRLPPRIVLAVGRVLSLALRDVLLTPDEVTGLSSELLISDQPPNGTTSLSRWLDEHGAHLGHRYASELARHFR